MSRNRKLWLSVMAIALVLAFGGFAYILGINNQSPPNEGVVPGIGGGPGSASPTPASIESPVPTETPLSTETPSPTPSPTIAPDASPPAF